MFATHRNPPWQILGGFGGGDPSPAVSVTTRKVECVGPSFLSFNQAGPEARARCGTHAAEDEDSPLQYHQDPDFGYLCRLDPKDWRNQDHYAVLGLKAQRFRATQDDVKRAYRAKMLMHHPDKRKHVVVRAEDNYFSCISRAWEVLGSPKSRRSYDSVDKTFDDSIPSNNKYNKEHFYRVFSKAFERNARWSKVHPVPGLGGPASTREEVDEFYTFWYDFPSWREFTYQVDDDDDDRDFAEERKLRKKEMARVRRLVDLSYALDPRISVFKQQERDRKAAVRQNRKEQARARLAEAASRLEAEQTEARLEKERQEAEAKELQEALKAERNARKRALKGSRAKLRRLVKANGYYVVASEELVPHMMALEDVVDQTLMPDKLEQLVRDLERRGRESFLSAMEEAKRGASSTSKKDGLISGAWTEDEVKLLAKAERLFPSERKYRWELVADFVNQCAAATAKTAKDAEAKWGEVESSCPSEVTRMASADDNQDDDTHVASAGTEEAVADQANEPSWTESELAALHAAVETYPAFTPGRWEKISGVVGTRSRDQCLKEAKRKAR